MSPNLTADQRVLVLDEPFIQELNCKGGGSVKVVLQTAMAVIIAAMLSPAPIKGAIPDTTPVDTSTCELHVWPGNGFHTTYYGWFHGGTVDGALKGRNGYSPLSSEMLSTTRQIAQLEKLPIAELTGLIGYRQILHHEPLASRTIRNDVARHAPDASTCYAELMIDTIIFEDHALGGKGINTVARFRRFNGDTQTQSYGGFAVQPVMLPATGKEAGKPELVAAAFEDAFAKSVVAFAANARANIDKHRTK